MRPSLPGPSARASRAIAWLVLALMVAPISLPLAAAEPPVSYGKAVGPGVFGVPFAESTNLSFPYSYPPLGTGPLNDRALVYDTSLSFEIVNPNPTPAVFLVVTETWIPGTVTIIENVTGPNGTYRIVPVSVPSRLDTSWSNGTVSAQPYSNGDVTLPLQFSAQVRPLELRVGTATWELSYLTPATSSAAGILTAGGAWVFGALVAASTFVAFLVALVAARGLASRIGRSPPVPRIWPIGWAGGISIWFFFGYVSFNQFLGPLSPAIVLPVPLALVAFPYLPRLFTRYFDMTEIEGIEAITLDDASNPKVVIPIVRHQGSLKCAPQTWREALLSHWLGLPEVIGYEVSLLGGEARVQPRLMPVSCPLPDYYRAEVTASCWYDARKGILRPRHRLSWWTQATETVFGPDGITPTGTRTRRRFSPHISKGYLQATFPPKRPVAHELAAVRSAEVEAHDNEIDRIENADLRGTLRHLSRTYARDSLVAHREAADRQDQPRTREEIARLVERNRKSRGEPTDDGKQRSRED